MNHQDIENAFIRPDQAKTLAKEYYSNRHYHILLEEISSKIHSAAQNGHIKTTHRYEAGETKKGDTLALGEKVKKFIKDLGYKIKMKSCEMELWPEEDPIDGEYRILNFEISWDK